jgi:hypothetical protein
MFSFRLSRGLLFSLLTVAACSSGTGEVTSSPAASSTGAPASSGAPSSQTSPSGGTAPSDTGQTTTPPSNPTTKVGLNDVSILVPLSANATLADATSAGRGGDLLSAELFAKLPAIPTAPTRADYSVIGIRIDPCFAALTDQGDSCENQIRLILQPHAKAPQGPADAPLHLFYSLTRAELKAFVNEYLALVDAAGGYSSDGLVVHPILAKEALNGAFTTGLRSLVLKYAGKANLAKVTFIFVTPPGADRRLVWTFGGFVVASDGSTTAVKIATLGDAEKQTITQAGPPTTFAMTFDPAPTGDATILPLLDTSTALTSPEATIRAAYDTATAFANPTMNTPNTVDCASCHALHARRLVEQTFGLSPDTSVNAYAPAKGVRGATVRDAGSIRAFGYQGAQVAVSARVVNESVAVADYINTKVL